MNVNQQDLTTIITDPDGAETLVRTADALGKDLQRQRLTTNQIRAIFGEVRQIQAEWGISEESRRKALRKLILLKPKMAYRARRESGRAVEALRDVLDPAVDLVINEKDREKQDRNFQNFVDFFEAILAYHKAYGGN